VGDFRKILCPVDFDPNSLSALDLAKDVALKYQAKLYLLHVARIPNPDMDAPVAIAPHPHWERTAYDRLMRTARQKLAGLTYEVVVKEGIAKSGILEAINELGIDLVVMASHGRSGLTHFLLGSVAEEVVRSALCPVLVVKPNK
jgi:nucleotide-binding universal stress UspA family protein